MILDLAQKLSLCLILGVPSRGSTVVEHLPSNLKVKDSSLATDGVIGTGRESKWWDQKVFNSSLNKWSTYSARWSWIAKC